MAGRTVQFTVTEYEVLRLLSLDAGRITTNEFLLRRVWGERQHTGSDPVRRFVKNMR